MSPVQHPLSEEEIQAWPSLASYVAALSRLTTSGSVTCYRGDAAPDDAHAAAAWQVSLPHDGETWLVHVERPQGVGKPAWREPVLTRMLDAMKGNLAGGRPLREWPQAVKTAWSLVITHPTRAMSLAEVASCVDLSAGYLGEQFEKITGSSFKRVLRDERMQHACHVLETTSRRVSEIASTMGGLSLSQFNRCFVAATGMSPSEWRRRFASRKSVLFSASSVSETSSFEG
ncbi:helix-turn-helix domain-containing protein [Luteolibacter luteus]|uniref:Helix-turn-helix transcriptional regulator n=1 Tax=Luteolibacter luteus TaxID=2728835 RepID=A0A858RIH0_9BACT|nr:AraC family transcriptional regulator [Luteolibacter luteus]QJE96298.1 helix-turn-helix transcriptional regulator [Luteolibacter luteus]